MNDLTEQWKKGELLDGEDYYIKWKDSEVFTATFVDFMNRKMFQRMELEFEELPIEHYLSVLAPVPSYDELQNMNKAVNECMAANIKLVEQNAQLKEQINKCCLDAINRGTANAVKAVKEFGMPERIERLEKQLKIVKKYLPLIKRNVSVGSLAYTYVANAQTEIKELEK